MHENPGSYCSTLPLSQGQDRPLQQCSPMRGERRVRELAPRGRQKLVKSIKPGVPRCPTNEIMIVNPMIRELISRGEDKKIPDAIRIGYNEGMVDFNENLRQLVERGDVDRAAALEVSPNPEQLKMALKGIRVAAAGIL